MSSKQATQSPKNSEVKNWYSMARVFPSGLVVRTLIPNLTPAARMSRKEAAILYIARQWAQIHYRYVPAGSKELSALNRWFQRHEMTLSSGRRMKVAYSEEMDLILADSPFPGSVACDYDHVVAVAQSLKAIEGRRTRTSIPYRDMMMGTIEKGAAPKAAPSCEVVAKGVSHQDFIAVGELINLESLSPGGPQGKGASFRSPKGAKMIQILMEAFQRVRETRIAKFSTYSFQPLLAG